MNCFALENVISRSSAVRRVLDGLELGQIWIDDRTIAPLDEEQEQRMLDEFGSVAIPLHVMIDPVSGLELARFDGNDPREARAYLEFLNKGLAAYRKARK